MIARARSDENSRRAELGKRDNGCWDAWGTSKASESRRPMSGRYPTTRAYERRGFSFESRRTGDWFEEPRAKQYPIRINDSCGIGAERSSAAMSSMAAATTNAARSRIDLSVFIGCAGAGAMADPAIGASIADTNASLA